MLDEQCNRPGRGRRTASHAERAIREGRELPAGTTVHLLAAAVLVVIVAAGISVLV